MDQITITRKEFRKKAINYVHEMTMRAVEELKAEESAIIALCGAAVAAGIEDELFGKETEEE